MTSGGRAPFFWPRSRARRARWTVSLAALEPRSVHVINCTYTGIGLPPSRIGLWPGIGVEKGSGPTSLTPAAKTATGHNTDSYGHARRRHDMAVQVNPRPGGQMQD